MVKSRYLFLNLLLLIPALLWAQNLRLVPYDGTAGSFLNAQMVTDTTANGAALRSGAIQRTYVLQRGGIYLANATFANPGWTLRVKANDTTGVVSKPIIYLYPTGTGANPGNPPGNWLQIQGDIVLKNLIVSGYFEPIDSNLNNLQGGLMDIAATTSGWNITIDSCILSTTNGNHIRTDGAAKAIKVTNSIFCDLGFLGRSNLGAGKAFDIRDVSVDTLWVVNNTFVNWQDRIIRHYPLTGPTGPLKFLRFDHNTLANGMSYHGLLSLGGMGLRGIITNNLFIDPFSLGNDTDAVRQVEYAPSGEKDPYGGNRMNWILDVPNDTTKWSISNNYYAISDSGQAFYNQFASAGVTGEGAPLTWHLNSKIADSTHAFNKVTLTLTKIPRLMTVLNRWYRDPNGGNKSKNTPTSKWNLSDDYDRHKVAYYRDTLNCTYSTSSAAYTGATGGFPAGDLNWFPTRKTAWLSDPASGVQTANAPIPEQYTLNQNYPNPFNPSTLITYSVPKESNVKLEIFDLLGRKIATLVSERKVAGNYSVEFNASALGSGVYIYRLTTPGVVLAKKMILIK